MKTVYKNFQLTFSQTVPVGSRSSRLHSQSAGHISNASPALASFVAGDFRLLRRKMESSESPLQSQPASASFTPPPRHEDGIFSKTPTQQEMEGIQMVLASLEANLTMNTNGGIESNSATNENVSFQDREASNLSTQSLSPTFQSPPPHVQPPTLPFTGEMHQTSQENAQSLFPQQSTSHPGSATASPPGAMFHFPSPPTTEGSLPGKSAATPSVVDSTGGGQGQSIHGNIIQSGLTSPGNTSFSSNLIPNIPAVVAADMMGMDLSSTNGQNSEGHAPSGYVTPQSSGPGVLDYPPNIQSSVSPSQSAFTSPSGVGDDRNSLILDLARRLQNSATFLSQAVQEGKDMEVETQLAHVDQLIALVSPLRKNPSTASARRETISSPPITFNSVHPPPVPMIQHSPPQPHTNSASGEIQLQKQLSGPSSPRASNTSLLLDNEASRKRCASAVTDGDRIIKSLKIETKESQPQQSHQLPSSGGANPDLIGVMPQTLQVGMNEMPSSTIDPLSSNFMTPLTPSSNDPFFAQPPLTPASSIPSGTGSISHNMYGVVPSNPPSAPVSRPPSPGTLRRIQPPQLPHTVPSMVHQSPPMSTLTNAQFTMEHRGMSWNDLTAAANMQQHPIAYAGYSNGVSAAVQSAATVQQQVPSYTSNVVNTQAQPRLSRSSSYSRVENNAAASSQIMVPGDQVMDRTFGTGYVTPVSTKIEEYDMDAFLASASSYPNNYSLSTPHSPQSSSSEDSFELFGMSSPSKKVLPSNVPAGMVSPTAMSNGHHPSSSIDSNISMDDFAEINHIPNPNHPGNEIPPEYKLDVERVFFEFLNRICSNLEATDAKGELIHQTLMAKKMQRLDESPDFRPFKFRIQAFTNAFLEELSRQGYPEDKLPMKKVRGYLWIQPFISRYNEDGKKAKSKGNHIWNIDAKKHPEGGWIFRRFHRRIAGSPPGVAYQGLQWSYKPHIWDPQQSRKNENVHYSSPWLPAWLHWDRDTLVGIPPEDADSVDITVEARFTENGLPEVLTSKFHLTVAPINAGDVNHMNALGMHIHSPVAGDNGLTRRVNSDSLIPSYNSLPQRPPLPRLATRVNGPPSTGSSRVVEVLNDTLNRVIQDQNIASISYADPQLHASLERQHNVLSVAMAAIEGAPGSFDPQNVQTNAIATVGKQFVGSTVDVLMQGRRTMSNFAMTSEPNLTVKEVSEVTQKAIARAVDSLQPTSSEVEILMAARQFVQTIRSTNTHPEAQLINPTFMHHPNIPDMTYPHGSALPPPLS